MKEELHDSSDNSKEAKEGGGQAKETTDKKAKEENTKSGVGKIKDAIHKLLSRDKSAKKTTSSEDELKTTSDGSK